MNLVLSLISVLFIGSPAFASDKIFEGSHVAAADPAAKYIVRLTNKSANYVCTGAIYSDDLIVTAGHCVVGAPDDVVIEFLKPGTSEVVATRMPSTRIMDERFNIFAASRDQLNPTAKHDFGGFGFKGGLPQGFETVPKEGCNLSMTEGQTATTYGYGQTEGFEPPSTSLKSATQIYRGIQNNMLVFTPGNGQVCRGDSGGPIFTKNSNGKLCWVGVNSTVRSTAVRPSPRNENGAEPERVKGCSSTVYGASVAYESGGLENLFETWDVVAGMIGPAEPTPAEAYSFGGALR